MLNIKKFVFNPFQINTYIISNSLTNQAFIIDAGNYTDNENALLLNYIEKEKLKIEGILITHGHIDHILGLNFIQNKITQKIYLNFADRTLYDAVDEYADMFELVTTKPPKPVYNLNDFNSIFLGDEECLIKHTPGHSPGGSVFIFPTHKCVFSGDTIFFESIGRTDLPGGNLLTLLNSIQDEILSLPRDFELFPGHGDKTTVGYERLNNPFLEDYKLKFY